MTEFVNPVTGEVEDSWNPDDAEAPAGVLMPLNLSELSEETLAQAFPTAGQLEQGLLVARGRVGRAATVLPNLSSDLKAAKRELTKAKAHARKDARDSGEYRTEGDIVAAIERDPAVQAAYEAVDDAAIALEYGRELKSALHADIDILRSLNTNMRSAQ